MQRHVSSERRPWLRTGIYTFMTIVVTVVVSLLLLVVLGYQFNEKDGKLEQGGLLQLYSIPTGAKITLNQVVLGSSTNTKRTVDAGSQFVTYEKQGYRNWQKSITV
ncbi:PEGA domain-containing protein, partial [Candidatus Saccharibacteria bacterium]|nr:PEGA domain-containing protein [Candidatus Saccharibacteria bacterium]